MFALLVTLVLGAGSEVIVPPDARVPIDQRLELRVTREGAYSGDKLLDAHGVKGWVLKNSLLGGVLHAAENKRKTLPKGALAKGLARDLRPTVHIVVGEGVAVGDLMVVLKSAAGGGFANVLVDFPEEPAFQVFAHPLQMADPGAPSGNIFATVHQRDDGSVGILVRDSDRKPSQGSEASTVVADATPEKVSMALARLAASYPPVTMVMYLSAPERPARAWLEVVRACQRGVARESAGAIVFPDATLADLVP